jgi:hypothetical protein
MRTKIHSENLKGGDHFGDIGFVNKRIILKWFLNGNIFLRMWTGFIWLRAESSGGLL